MYNVQVSASVLATIWLVISMAGVQHSFIHSIHHIPSISLFSNGRLELWLIMVLLVNYSTAHTRIYRADGIRIRRCTWITHAVNQVANYESGMIRCSFLPLLLSSLAFFFSLLGAQLEWTIMIRFCEKSKNTKQMPVSNVTERLYTYFWCTRTWSKSALPALWCQIDNYESIEMVRNLTRNLV